MSYKFCQMLNGKRFFEKSCLIEKDSYFPEINEFCLNTDGNGRVKFLRSNIIHIILATIDAHDGSNIDIFLHNDVFRPQRVKYIGLLFNEPHQLIENTHQINLLYEALLNK